MKKASQLPMNERQFQHLLDRYLRGECTPEETELLHRWYDSFQESEVVEDVSDDRVEQEMRGHIQQRIAEDEQLRYHRRQQRRARLRRQIRVAASVLLIVGLGWGGYLAYTTQPTPEVVWLERTTQKGQRATVALPDGTKVHLNVDSKLSFPERFSAEKREVGLDGEAFFEVTGNPQRPFIIKSGNLTTTVLGTSFNIKAFADEPIAVTVATGQVRVQASDEVGTPREVLLYPQQQALYDGALLKKDVDTKEFVGWREKTIRFDDVPLSEAVAVLERWFDVSIEIENAQARSCRISGQYVNERLLHILESFEHILHVRYRLAGEHHIILEGDCH